MEEAFLNSSSLWATVNFGDSTMLNLMKIAILLIVVGSVPSVAKIHFFYLKKETVATHSFEKFR
jgi:hypothetical protein